MTEKKKPMLQFVATETDPKPWVNIPTSAMQALKQVQRIMNYSRYRNDQADDWTPDMNRDCQGKVAAAIVELHERFVPLDCMRGFVGECLVKREPARWSSHAILVVRVFTLPTPIDYVLDNRQTGIRTMAWMNAKSLYRNMRPAIRARIE